MYGGDSVSVLWLPSCVLKAQGLLRQLLVEHPDSAGMSKQLPCSPEREN